jgi:hypothetical protein
VVDIDQKLEHQHDQKERNDKPPIKVGFFCLIAEASLLLDFIDFSQLF